MEKLVKRLRDELNKCADDYYNDVVVPLRNLVTKLKKEKLDLQNENQKLKEALEFKVKKPWEVYLTHLDAERYKKMLLEKNQEIAQLKKEIYQLKNPTVGRYTINVKRR